MPELVPLDAVRHDRKSFSCGEPTLDGFLHGEAQWETSGSTWVLVPDRDSPEILAYLTWVPDPEELMDPEFGFEGQEEILLRCLAVRKDLQGVGWGRDLMFYAIEQVVKASTHQPIRRLVFDPIDDRMRRRILESWGLPARSLRPASRRMMITIEDMRDLVGT